MIAAAINTHALVKMAYSSVVAGVGVAVIFSLAILGVARSSEMRREHRTTAAVGIHRTRGRGPATRRRDRDLRPHPRRAQDLTPPPTGSRARAREPRYPHLATATGNPSFTAGHVPASDG